MRASTTGRKAHTAGPLTTDVAFQHTLTRQVVQLLADVFTEELESTAATTLGALRFVLDRCAGQLEWQRHTLGLLLGFVGSVSTSSGLGQLRLHGGQVSVDRIFQQLRLHALELITAAGKLVALE